MGPFKLKKIQSQEFWLAQPLCCRDSETVYSHHLLGYNGPLTLQIEPTRTHDAGRRDRWKVEICSDVDKA